MNTMSLAFAVLFAATAIAYAGVVWLSGEDPVATWLDERRLRRADLRALDAACAANPNCAGLVVSLTTIPSRIGALELTVKSLLRQTARAQDIRVCVPECSERERCAYEIPTWLVGLRCVTLVRCVDEGPATKFLPTLRAVDPEQGVVVVDDDRVYHPRLLECYAALAQENGGVVLSAAGWRVPGDLTDRPTTLWRRLAGAAHVPRRANQLRRAERTDIVQGVHSYLVRPKFFDLTALGDFSAAPPTVRFVDDVWISAHCRAEKWLRPMRLRFTDYKPRAHRQLFDRTSLGGNVNRAARDEERGNSIALRHFSGCWESRPDGGCSRGADRRDI